MINSSVIQLLHPWETGRLPCELSAVCSVRWSAEFHLQFPWPQYWYAEACVLLVLLLYNLVKDEVVGRVLLYSHCGIGQGSRGILLLWCSSGVKKKGRLNRCHPVVLLSSQSYDLREQTFLGVFICSYWCFSSCGPLLPTVIYETLSKSIKQKNLRELITRL